MVNESPCICVIFRESSEIYQWECGSNDIEGMSEFACKDKRQRDREDEQNLLKEEC